MSVTTDEKTCRNLFFCLLAQKLDSLQVLVQALAAVYSSWMYNMYM